MTGTYLPASLSALRKSRIGSKSARDQTLSGSALPNSEIKTEGGMDSVRLHHIQTKRFNISN